jgi:hypothetical protein
MNWIQLWQILDVSIAFPFLLHSNTEADPPSLTFWDFWSAIIGNVQNFGHNFYNVLSSESFKVESELEFFYLYHLYLTVS